MFFTKAHMSNSTIDSCWDTMLGSLQNWKGSPVPIRANFPTPGWKFLHPLCFEVLLEVFATFQPVPTLDPTPYSACVNNLTHSTAHAHTHIPKYNSQWTRVRKTNYLTNLYYEDSSSPPRPFTRIDFNCDADEKGGGPLWPSCLPAGTPLFTDHTHELA